MNENVAINIPVNLFEAWVGSTRSSWIRFTCFLSLLVLILLSIAQYIRGHPIRLYSEPTFIITAYGLSTWLFMKLLLEKTVKNLKRLTDDSAFNQLVTDVFSLKYKRRGWLILIAGGVFGIGEHLRFVIVREYPLGSELLYFIVNFIAFVVLAWFLHTTLTSIKFISMLVRHTKTTNIFDPTPFQPVAQWSLAVSLTIIGGLTIIILVLPKMFTDLVYLTILISFLVVVGVVFIIGMWSAHQVMRNNKLREINRVNKLLVEIHDELLAYVKERQLEKAGSLLKTSSELCAHKQILQKTNEWPVTIRNIGSLVSSALIPICIAAIKSLIGV